MENKKGGVWSSRRCGDGGNPLRAAWTTGMAHIKDNYCNLNFKQFSVSVLKLDLPSVKVSILLLDRSNLTRVETVSMICGISGQNLPVIQSSVNPKEFRMGRRYLSLDKKDFCLYTVLKLHLFIDILRPTICCHKFRWYLCFPTGIASSGNRIPLKHL